MTSDLLPKFVLTSHSGSTNLKCPMGSSKSSAAALRGALRGRGEIAHKNTLHGLRREIFAPSALRVCRQKPNGSTEGVGRMVGFIHGATNGTGKTLSGMVIQTAKQRMWAVSRRVHHGWARRT